MHGSEISHDVEAIDHKSGDAFEHRSASKSARHGLCPVTMGWIGFPMIVTRSMTRLSLVVGMDSARAVDNVRDVGKMPDSRCVPIHGVQGHFAGGGANPTGTRFIDEQLKPFLACPVRS